MNFEDSPYDAVETLVRAAAALETWVHSHGTPPYFYDEIVRVRATLGKILREMKE
jgi:hypothetical protein